MKKFILVFIAFFALVQFNQAQKNTVRPKLAILNLDTKGFALDQKSAGNIARLELEKLQIYDLMDRYDIDFMLDKDSQIADNCYGKLCLVEIGKKIKADKMLTGSIELLNDRIYVTFRLIDVGSATVEKSQVLDFLNVKNQIQEMIGLTLKKMFNVTYDEAIYNQLTKSDAFNTAVNSPDIDKVNLNGPRMGVAFFSGETAKRIKAPSKFGGMDATPIMFQFGYQLEAQYIGQGNFQALFEFIPMITGLDQGKVIPSITILNGLRENRLGLEFAFGPTFLLSRRAEGFYDSSDGNWRLANTWDYTKGQNPNEIVKRLDERGTIGISTGFIFAAGKTFRSGKLNIPVNIYIRPNSREGSQYGISFGFNTSSLRKSNK
ncbi:MAG: hypothetical protein ACOYOA_08235 [Saprospiraceae bacterium]